MAEPSFYIRCVKKFNKGCGILEVPREKFESFFTTDDTRPILAILDQKIKAGAVGGTIVFEDGCPECAPTVRKKGKVFTLRAPE